LNWFCPGRREAREGWVWQNGDRCYMQERGREGHNLSFKAVTDTYLTSWGLSAMTLLTKLALTDTSWALS